MYYEEKVINGVLCYRGTPDGEWTEFSKQTLTKRLMEYTGQIFTFINN